MIAKSTEWMDFNKIYNANVNLKNLKESNLQVIDNNLLTSSGIYMIRDEKLDQLIYIGLASGQGGFNDRIQHHFNKSIGKTNTNGFDTADTKSWKKYRMEALSNDRVPTDSWSIKFLIMENVGEKDKQLIDWFEDQVMLGFSSICSDGNTVPSGLYRIPLCNDKSSVKYWRELLIPNIPKIEKQADKSQNIPVNAIDEVILDDGDISMCNKESFLANLDANSLDSWQYFVSNLDCSEIYLNFTATNNYDCRFMFDTGGARARVLGRVFWQPGRQRFCFHFLADNNLINIGGVLNAKPHVDGPQKSRVYLNLEEMKNSNVINAVSNALKLGIEKLSLN